MEDSGAEVTAEQADVESTGFRLKLQAPPAQRVEQKTTKNQSQKHKRNIQNLTKLASKAKELAAGLDEDSEITQYQDHAQSSAAGTPLLPLDGARRASRNISRNAGTVADLHGQLGLPSQVTEAMKSTFSPDIDEYLRAPEAEDDQQPPSRKPHIAVELLTPSKTALQ